MIGVIRVRVMEVKEDGIRIVHIQRHNEPYQEREFSFESLNEYLEKLENYCIEKDFKYVVSFDEDFNDYDEHKKRAE